MSTSVAKNTAYMTLASVAQKVIALVYFTLVARTIGVEDTGRYTLALSFTTIFVVFVDLGLTNVLVREAARLKEKIQLYFSSILSMKIALGLCSYGAMVIAVHLLGYDSQIRLLVYLSGVTMLIDSLHLSVYGVLRACGNLRYEAIGMSMSQFLTLCIGSVVLYTGAPIAYLMLAFTVPSFCNALFALIVAKKVYGIRPVPAVDKETLGHIGSVALPFAIAAIFARIYSYIDAILLSKLIDTTAVGLYSIATKITFAFQFIPLALMAAVYPRFSEYFVHDKTKLSFLFEQSIRYLLIIVLPIAVGLSLIARPVIVSFYTTDYLASVLPLQILLVSLIFSFLSFPVGGLLNASNRQVTQTTIVGVVMVLNILLNLLLIPHYGIVGAALSALCGNILLTLFGSFFILKITHIPVGRLFLTVLKTLVSAAVMGVAVVATLAYAHFAFAIVSGGIVYALMLLVTRVTSIAQLKQAFVMVKR